MLLRPAPGVAQFDFGQMVPFYQPEPPFSWPYLRFQFPGQQPAPPMMNATGTFTSLSSFLADRSPFGSILRIEILSTWRASRFVALDRIQFVDPLGRVIPSSYCRLFSDPLPLDDDGRPYRHIIEGLVVNRTDSPEKSWKPWRSLYLDSSAVREGSASLRNKRSSLFVLFDTPVMIAFMRVGEKEGCEIDLELPRCGGVESEEGARDAG